MVINKTVVTERSDSGNLDCKIWKVVLTTWRVAITTTIVLIAEARTVITAIIKHEIKTKSSAKRPNVLRRAFF